MLRFLILKHALNQSSWVKHDNMMLWLCKTKIPIPLLLEIMVCPWAMKSPRSIKATFLNHFKSSFCRFLRDAHPSASKLMGWDWNWQVWVLVQTRQRELAFVSGWKVVWVRFPASSIARKPTGVRDFRKSWGHVKAPTRFLQVLLSACCSPSSCRFINTHNILLPLSSIGSILHKHHLYIFRWSPWLPRSLLLRQ